ncbi:hypothetical protein PG985_000079 [Apiospora marii]|uniref:uncharacterized protein n=1 Tax=Apiospora marii TaxID=335849 RepID=UPI00312D6866
MADPLSVAGLAAGVVSLGIQVTGGLVSYLDAIRSREEDLRLAKQYVGSIQAAINHIDSSPSCTQASQMASASIKFSVDACKAQLKGLEALVNKLSSTPGSSATLRSKLRDTSKKLAYAYRRQDVKELEERLSRANSSLQGAMQAIGLDVQHSMNETLTTVRIDTEHTRAGVQSMASELLVVRSEATLASTHLRKITATLPAIAEDVAKTGPLIVDHVDGLELRLAEQNQVMIDGFSTSTQRLDRIEAVLRSSENCPGAHGQSANAIATRLLSKPSTLREVVDVTESLPTAAHNKATPRTSSVGVVNPREQRPGILGRCNCRRPRRVRQRRLRKWGPLLAFDEIETIDLHRPDCEFSPFATGDRSRKLGISYAGMRVIASWAIAYSFSASSGAGGCSIMPSFTYYPTVDKRTSPIFRIIALLFGVLDLVEGLDGMIEGSQQRFAEICTSRISQLIKDQKASPLDVDSENNTLISTLVSNIPRVYLRYSYHHSGSTFPLSTITDLLTMLLGYGAPAMSCNLEGHTPISVILRELSNSTFLPTLQYREKRKDFAIMISDVILLKTPEILPPLAKPSETHPVLDYLGPPEVKYPEDILDVLMSSQDIAEALGCGPLSLAVLAQDESRVETILDTLPSSMDENNILGLTPLHLALDKPACLQFTKQLKFRREALKQKALKHFSHSQRLQWALNTPVVLDSNAQVAAELLYNKGHISSFEAYGVSSGSLSCTSVYHHLLGCSDAAIFYEMGFRDLSAPDNHGITPLFAAAYTDRAPDTIARYWIWLIEHGADVSSPLTINQPSSHAYCTHSSPAGGTTHAHYIAAYLDRWRLEIYPDYASLLGRHILDAGVVDNCSCGCSLHGCTPATILFRILLRWSDEENRLIGFDFPCFQRLLKWAGEMEDTKWVESATRALTFNALGLTHTCCQHCYDCKYDPRWIQVLIPRFRIEEVDDIRDVESEDLGLLESLLDDFQARLDEISAEGPLRTESYWDFIQGYWLNRMRGEWETKRQNRAWDEEKHETMLIGVNWKEETMSETPSKDSAVSEISEDIGVSEDKEANVADMDYFSSYIDDKEANVADRDILSECIDELDRIVAGKPCLYFP